jgi:hypothetical protein
MSKRGLDGCTARHACNRQTNDTASATRQRHPTPTLQPIFAIMSFDNPLHATAQKMSGDAEWCSRCADRRRTTRPEVRRAERNGISNQTWNDRARLHLLRELSALEQQKRGHVRRIAGILPSYWLTTEASTSCTAAPSPSPGILRRCHVVLECIFKEFRVRLEVQRLHHPVLVKCHRAGLYVDNICHFFHRHPFR